MKSLAQKARILATDLNDLQRIPGIGPSLARDLVDLGTAKSQYCVAAVQSDSTSGFACSVTSIRISVFCMFFVALSISPLSGVTTPNALNGGTGRTQSRRCPAMR